MQKQIDEVMGLVEEYKDVAVGGFSGWDERMAIESKLRELLPVWQPIETAPKQGREMFVVRGFNVTNLNAGCRNYTTDAYCVWPGDEGNGWVRWPHTFPPTHWMPLPKAPA